MSNNSLALNNSFSHCLKVVFRDWYCWTTFVFSVLLYTRLVSHMQASLQGVHTQHPNRYFNLLIFACSGCYSCSGHSSILGSIPSKTGKYIKMIVHILLHHTVHYTKNIAQLCTGSGLVERVRQMEVGGVARWVLYTWQLLGLALKGTWLAMCGPILALAG